MGFYAKNKDERNALAKYFKNYAHVTCHAQGDPRLFLQVMVRDKVPPKRRSRPQERILQALRTSSSPPSGSFFAKVASPNEQTLLVHFIKRQCRVFGMWGALLMQKSCCDSGDGHTLWFNLYFDDPPLKLQSRTAHHNHRIKNT